MSSCFVNGRDGFMVTPPLAQAEPANAAIRTIIAAPSNIRCREDALLARLLLTLVESQLDALQHDVVNTAALLESNLPKGLVHCDWQIDAGLNKPGPAPRLR
jgi:hypothetical protein